MICCFVVLGWQPADASASSLDRAERKVVRLVNRIRARHGLRRLKASPALASAAANHTGDMLRSDFFGHASSDGTPMGKRVRRYTAAGWIGENLAFVSKRRGNTAARAVRMWMRSPGHRAILLASKPRRIGVGKRTGAVGATGGAVYTLDVASKG